MEFPSEVSDFGCQSIAGASGRRGRDQTLDIFRGILSSDQRQADAPSDSKHGGRGQHVVFSEVYES
jgi:hypothetical protein